MESSNTSVMSMINLPAALVLAVATLATPALLVSLQARDAKARDACAKELQQLGSALLAQIDQGQGPALSPVRGNLAPENGFADGSNDDARALYLGYMLEDEEDFKAFASYYSSRTAQGLPLEDAIPLPAARADGRSAILRVRSLTERPEGSAWQNWYKDPSLIPLLIERSDRHDARGRHIVFMDGHVGFVPHARSTIFPMARSMTGGLNDLDSLQPAATQ